jgi:hypothetical protein
VMCNTESGLEVVRMAPKRPSPKLPFSVWIALAKAVPLMREDGRNGVGF